MSRQISKLDYDLFVAGPGGQMAATWRNALGWAVFLALHPILAFSCIWLLGLTE